MKWVEFSTLLAGLNQETPLGALVAIRTEEDPERLKSFTPEMKKIRNAWVKQRIEKKMKRDPNFARREAERMQSAFRQAFG